MNPRYIEEMGWRMGEVYAAVTDRIIINLAKHFPYIAEGSPITDTWNYQIRKLAEMGQVTRETETIILESMKGADQALADILEETIRESLKPVEKPLRQAAEKGLLVEKGFLPPETAPALTQAFSAYYRQSSDKLNLVNTVMLESTQQAYRQTVADIATRFDSIQGILNTETGEVVAGVSTLNEAVRDAVRKMAENEITGFVDHADRHWSPEAYVTMDIRTTLANTGRSAVFEQMDNYGDDLYMVSYHDGARPLCYPWQGKVISRSGRTGETTDIDGNTIRIYAQNETSFGEAAGLFGINCGHYPIPFIPGFSKPAEVEQNADQAEKEYEESQKQRALERNYRYAKRDLMMAQARNDPDEIAKQKIRVKNARNELNNFCDETGRARRSGRERTPINASWPETKAVPAASRSPVNIRESTHDLTPDELIEEAKRQGSSLTPWKIEEYVESSYGGYSLGDEISRFIDRAPEALKAGEGTVYRGLAFENRAEYDSFIYTHKPGKAIVTRRAGLSWTSSMEVAEEFSINSGSNAVILINDETVKNAISIQKIADTPNPSRELLFSSSTDFEVTSWQQESGVLYMKVKQIPITPLHIKYK